MSQGREERPTGYPYRVKDHVICKLLDKRGARGLGLHFTNVAGTADTMAKSVRVDGL